MKMSGKPVACAAAIATIGVLLDEDLARQAGEKGEYLLGKFAELGARYPNLLKLWRGRGLMLGLEFADGDLGYAVSKNLFARQILIGGTFRRSSRAASGSPICRRAPRAQRSPASSAQISRSSAAASPACGRRSS